MLCLLTVLLAASAATPGSVTLDVARETSFFDPLPIRVTGLRPLHPITIRASMLDAAGSAFTSSARFVPHIDGVVDTRTSVANGTYDGIDPQGLIWSMQGKGAFAPSPTDPMQTTIEVFDENDHLLASAKVDRRVVSADVKVTELRRPDAPVVGRFYEHTGTKRPGLVAVTGSNGGIDPRMAPYLAAHGYDVLAVAYFHFDGVPQDLIEIPLEYFRAAAQWLAGQPSVDAQRIAIVGVSKGGEAALAVAAHDPELFRAVAALVPAHALWEGSDARGRFGGDPRFDVTGRSAWSYEGRPLPFARKELSAERLADRPRGFLDMYEPVVDRGVDPEAVIPVERIRAPLFVATAGDDLAWPSLKMGREIQRRLLTRGLGNRVELREYPLAGHFGVSPPGAPANIVMGGTPRENALAGDDVWSHLLAFFEASLR